MFHYVAYLPHLKLPNFSQLRQNWADSSVTPKIKVNPTQVSDHMDHPVEPLCMHHSPVPYLLDELLLPPQGVFHGVPHHLELPPALAQGHALGDDVERDQLGLQSPLAVLLRSLD